jgi:membrane-bound lytic murein transglycosylase D
MTQFQVFLLSVGLVAFNFMTIGTGSAAAVESNFTAMLETPDGLKRDVVVWERIFDEYSPEQCVFHDEWSLDVVYYVAPVPRVKGSKGSGLLQKHLKGIRLALSNIATRGRPAGEFEQKIFAAVPEYLRSQSFFREAGDRLRCQRGVEFASSLKRSRAYIPMIKDILKEKGLPQDLAYLPHLESGFNVGATSKAGAKGLWQFMKHTARSEGLQVRRGRDWRVDPLKSTEAATNYLGSIYTKFRTWDLAITSYNYGPNGVMRAVQKFGPDYMKIRTEHKTKIFGFAARNYYPSFLAARNVAMREEQKFSATGAIPTTIADSYETKRSDRRLLF